MTILQIWFGTEGQEEHIYVDLPLTYRQWYSSNSPRLCVQWTLCGYDVHETDTRTPEVHGAQKHMPVGIAKENYMPQESPLKQAKDTCLQVRYLT